MNGQMMLSEKDMIINEFIKRVNPYEKPPTLKMDLRAYAKYLKENGLRGEDIPADVMKQFYKK